MSIHIITSCYSQTVSNSNIIIFLLRTDTATNYKKFAKMKKLQHEPVNERQKQRVKKGIYHIQHINNFHNRLKKWMERFQGVATKYLDN